MVLSVPPLLEEMGRGVTNTLTHALAGWQGALWGAAQRLREKPEQTDGALHRWMGTAAQLSSVIEGSVVLGGDGVAPDVIPLSTEATPAVKLSNSGPLVRLEGAPGLSGRYTSLAKLIQSSVGIWPAAITVGDSGGQHAGGLRARDDRPVELQVVASSPSRLAFRLVDTATRDVISVVDSAEELAGDIGYGSKPRPWAAFLEGSLWGLPAVVSPVQVDATRQVANVQGMRDIASLWNFEHLHQERVPLLALVAFLAAAAEMPEARALANEISHGWVELTDSAKPWIDAKQFMSAVDQLTKAMLLSARSAAVLAAVRPARQLDVISAALYLGEVLQRTLSATHARTTAVVALGGLDSPRARRSLAQTTSGGSSYLTLTTPTASPVKPRQRGEAQGAEVDSEGEPIPSPGSMYAELKRLRRLTGRTAGAGATSEGQARKAARRGSDKTASASHGLPSDLTDLSDEVLPEQSARSHAIGPTMGACVCMPHTKEVRRLIPEFADEAPLQELCAMLDAGGMPEASTAFAQAATTVNTGIVPGRGTALEAEMLAEHIAQVLDDLVVAQALPVDHPAFGGEERPADWRQAAARGRALILATNRAFRTARHVGGPTVGRAGSSSDTTGEVRSDKVPEDSYAKVGEATTNSLKVLAASASVINSITTNAALRGERLRGSPFESLTSYSQAELDSALPGELDYFVGMYGQAATAYLVSNSRSLEEVSGKGVPAALVGIRRHLWLRALRWVHDTFGERRATQRRADVEKLALSLMAGAVPAEPVGAEGEKLIIELLGGSKPHRGAEIEKEGGSLSKGTVGMLVGESAQFSVRTAYRKWAKGLARCMGEVMLAARGRPSDVTTVVGTDGDFGVEEALLNVSEDLPAERLRSIGRYLLEEVHMACVRHRSQPAAELPDVLAIVADMSGEVFHHRRQEYQLESLAREAAAQMTESLTARLAAIEAKQGHAAPKAQQSGTKPGSTPPAASAKTMGKARAAPITQPGQATKSEGKKPASKLAGADMDDKAVSSTARQAAKALEESMTGAEGELFDSRIKAVATLQADFRKSVGASASRRLDDKEPCAWLALFGKCKEKACKSCASGLSFDAAALRAVKARCPASLLGAKPAQAKDPG